MNLARACAVAAMLLILTGGCAKNGMPTYRPWGMFGGYKDKQIAPNSWRVTAGVNGTPALGSAERIALYRAAELTRNAGFTHFQIVDGKSEQTYIGVGGMPPQMQGPGGSDMVIVAVNDASPPTSCQAESKTTCVTLEAEATMRKIAPLLHFPDRD
jgi:hypothetical protein